MKKKAMMSRVLAGICTVLLLAGCGNQNQSTNTAESTNGDTAVSSQEQTGSEG